MAARRLIIVLLVLIAVSTVAAALAPNPEDRRDRQARTEPVTNGRPGDERAEPPPALGRAFRAVVVDDRKGGSVRLRVGDQVTLTVKSRTTDQVQILGFGALEPVAPDAPARFDLLADRPGTFPIRLVEARRRLATIVVAKARRG
jgi:hypothetical protein